MFANKQSFKVEYAKRLIETYGVTVEKSHISERFQILGQMVRDFANIDWEKTYDKAINKDQKTLIYFSMEFLIGRLLLNNLQNMGIYDVVKEAKRFNIDINELEQVESDAGLGNGGFRALSSLFLDSIAR